MKVLTRKKEAELSELLARLHQFDKTGSAALEQCADALRAVNDVFHEVSTIASAHADLLARVEALEAASAANKHSGVQS